MMQRYELSGKELAAKLREAADAYDKFPSGMYAVTEHKSISSADVFDADGQVVDKRVTDSETIITIRGM